MAEIARASPVPRPASTPAAKPAAASPGARSATSSSHQQASPSRKAPSAGGAVQALPAFSLDAGAGSLLNFVLPFAGADSPQNAGDAEGGPVDLLGPQEDGRDRPFSTGLYVACKSPYKIMATGLLMDPSGFCQGQPGYSNPPVMPGYRSCCCQHHIEHHINQTNLNPQKYAGRDTVVRIESRPINLKERMEWFADSDNEMLQTLNGPWGTDVTVNLVRADAADGKEYEVVLKRHVAATAMDFPKAQESQTTLRTKRNSSSKTLLERPPARTTNTRSVGGVGIAIRRLDSQKDRGPVLVHRVNEHSQLSGKLGPGDRLISVNTEEIDNLPMRTIHALVDGQDGTKLTLQFESIVPGRGRRREIQTLPQALAFWDGIDRQPDDDTVQQSLEVVRSSKLPLSRATEDDDWVYKRAKPRDHELGVEEMPEPGGLFGFLGVPSILFQQQEEAPFGVLRIVVSEAKNLPVVGQFGAAGVFVRVSCADQTFSTNVVHQNTSAHSSVVRPVFGDVFELPIRKSQQEDTLIIEVIHKEAFIADIPFGQVKLPKAASFLSKKGAQDGWYSIHDVMGDPVRLDDSGNRPLVHIHADFHAVVEAQDRSDLHLATDSEFGNTLAPRSAPRSSSTSFADTKGRPQSLTSKSGASRPVAIISQPDTTGYEAIPVENVPSSHVMRGRFCLHMVAEVVKAPYLSSGSGYRFENLDKDFLEDERFEAFQAITAILKLKEQLLVQSEQERETKDEFSRKTQMLQRALNEMQTAVEMSQTDKAEAKRVQGEMSELKVRLRQQEEELNIMETKLIEAENDMSKMRAVMDRQDTEIEKSATVTQAATAATSQLKNAYAEIKGLEEEVSILQERLKQADTLVQTATSKPPVSMQDAAPWARNFESQWKQLRAVNAQHVLNLSSQLEAAQSPKDALVAVLQDVVNVLPRAVKMMQDADKFDKDTEEGFLGESMMVQRMKAYMKSIEDNSRQRHSAFVNFRRKIDSSSSADAGWKQLLEQEILHLQEHVESVNRDLVSCAMALRESLATHDDAHNLILLLNQSRDRRREVRNNLILLFKQQQEKLKINSNDISLRVNELINLIMDHSSDQMEAMEQGDHTVQRLVDQVLVLGEK